MDRKLRYQYLAKLISLIALVLRLLNPPFVYSVGVPFEAIHFIYLFVLFLITIIPLTNWRTPWETSSPWGLYRPVVFVCYFFRGEGGGVKLKPRNKGQLFDGGPSVRSHWSPFFAEWDRDRSVIKMHHYYRPLRGLFIDEASFSMYIATTNYSVWNLSETPVQNWMCLWRIERLSELLLFSGAKCCILHSVKGRNLHM